MTKLTDEQRQEALRDLEHRVAEAIDKTPRGIAASEIRQAIADALAYTGVS